MSALSLLILDDSESERLIMAHVLADAFPHADVHQAGSAQDALGICADVELDCVLLDYSMPQMDGVEFASNVRKLYPHLPLVLVTGVGDEMLVSLAMRSGCTDYIPKGRVNAESIQRAVERAIQTCAQARIIQEQREELENFAYALAHDFKQPIRQLRTFSQLISEELRSESDNEVQQHLAFLNLAARRLSDLVDVMSQYTLLSQPAELKDVALEDVIDTVRGSVASYVGEREAAFVVERSGALGGEGEAISQALLHCNEALLTQAVQNLVINGLKYNTSASPRVGLCARVQDSDCLIAVSDNGIGIEAQYLTEIFRPLVRLHTANEYPGTGLGLTLARKAMLAQGGSIWCESELGLGSTFFLKLPLAQVAA